MLSSKLISPSIHNALPLLENQALIDEQTLCAIGSIFAFYSVEDLVGVALLHKRFSLAPNNILTDHGFTFKRQLITTLTRDPAPTGDAFFWDGTKFQAFEYSRGKLLHLGVGFLKAFGNYLEGHKLASRIALTKLDPELGYKLLMEYCEPRIESPVSEGVSEVSANEVSAAEATEWLFEGGFPVITRTCARNPSTDHRKKR